MKKKNLFTWANLVRVIMTLLVGYGAYMSYNYMHHQFNQNAEITNKRVDSKLPKLKKQTADLKLEKRNAYNDHLVVQYHYKKAFNSPYSTDKSLKKWIKNENKVDDRLESVSEKYATKQKELSKVQKQYFNKTELHNSQSNLKIIVIILVVILLFFIWSV